MCSGSLTGPGLTSSSGMLTHESMRLQIHAGREYRRTSDLFVVFRNWFMSTLALQSVASNLAVLELSNCRFSFV